LSKLMTNKLLPQFKEDEISQIPAIKLLVNLGYTYLAPDEALELRGGKYTEVLLKSVLEDSLKRINSFSFRGEQHDFTDSNIQSAIRELANQPLNEGLIKTNERIYELLTLGKSFEQKVSDDKKSFSLRYIDWENPENNTYHVTEEFEVERVGSA